MNLVVFYQVGRYFVQNPVGRNVQATHTDRRTEKQKQRPMKKEKKNDERELAICEDSGSDRSARAEAEEEPRLEESFFLSFLWRSLRMTDFMVENQCREASKANTTHTQDRVKL